MNKNKIPASRVTLVTVLPDSLVLELRGRWIADQRQIIHSDDARAVIAPTFDVWMERILSDYINGRNYPTEVVRSARARKST